MVGTQIGGRMAPQTRTSDLINEQKLLSNIRRTWGLFYRDGAVVEIRIFLREAARSQLWTGFGSTLSGYFDDVNAAANLVVAIEKSAAPQATYITLNPVDKRLASRSYNRFTVAKRGEGAADKDITRRAWLLIDFDPIRPEGIAATEAEVQTAFERMELVHDELAGRGWPEPVTCFSGNGYHLDYALDVGCTDAMRDLLRDTLLGLQLQYGDKAKKTDLGSDLAEGQIGVKLDAGVFNAARITKLYGTWTRKGDEIDDRLHRQSYILTTPDELRPVTMAQLDAEAEVCRHYYKVIEGEKSKARSDHQHGQGSLIARFNREHSITDVMLAHGYTPIQGGSRWKRPGGDSGTVLVDLEVGKTFHFNTSDPMYNGHRNDAFDFETVYQFGGDQRAAIEHWADRYGVVLKGQGAKHRGPGDYVELRSQTPAPLPPATAEPPKTEDTPVIGPGEIVKLSFETFLQNMRRRVAELFNKDFVIACLNDQESGNARLLYAVARGYVVYDHTEKQWYWNNNLFWQSDDTANIYHLVSEVLKYYYDILYTTLRKEVKELEKLQGDEYNEERAKQMNSTDKIAKAAHARSKEMCNITPIRNLLPFAMSGERLGIVGDEWDRDKNLLGTQNAIIDLTTGKPVMPRPDQYIRTVIPISYNPACRFDLWHKTVTEILDGDMEKYRYIQRQLGYAMSGLATESDFYIWYGHEGRNGKELILTIVGDVLGSKLTGVLEPELLLVGGQPKSGPNEAKMTLKGRRIAWATETAVGRVMNVAAMKDFSGGIKMYSEPKFGKQVEWRRTHTLIMLTNHLPHINSNSTSEWDRIKLVVFPFTFIDNPDPAKPWEKLKDTTLLARIAEAELPGVLNWLIEGYHEYRHMGLATPEVVRNATKGYRTQEDSLGFFIAECCIVGDLYNATRKELYDAYLEHMGRDRPMGKKKFYEEIRRRPGIGEAHRNGVDYFTGIDLKLE